MNTRPFTRVLVANRGEIAVRVIRGCHERGLEAVAVYSDADADALYVRLADAAYHVGPPEAARSYLRGEHLLELAVEAGCDAVHPGYGFLSENASFARQVIEAGLVWIGPPPGAIDAMGSKTAARELMQAAGVPVVPGTVEPLTDAAEALRLADEMGYPVMLKAAAGGGGKGMRRVDSPDELAGALERARSEAQKSFGDQAVYIEKFVTEPRHVEIQILFDAHGTGVHLFERDCSIQRRHQKVVEEAPCPVLPAATREAMAAVAVKAGEAVDYVGAGTCEFLLGGDGNFYFLEMNTRLQVEHPITEAITGVDLVHAQLRVAAGEPLWFSQDDLAIHGHAMEYRIYAEDAAAGFVPAPGPLHGYREPGGPWVRVDSGVVEGSEVSRFYDPMIAKLVVWGKDREECLLRSRRALAHYRVVGTKTSLPFFLALLDDEAFQAGRYTTGFIQQEWLDANLSTPEEDAETVAIAAAIAAFEGDRTAAVATGGGEGGPTPWKRIHRWRSVARRTR